MKGYVIKAIHKKTEDTRFFVCLHNADFFKRQDELNLWGLFLEELRSEYSLSHIGDIHENTETELVSLLHKEITEDNQYIVTICSYVHIERADSFKPIKKINKVNFNIIDGKCVEIPDSIQVAVNKYNKYEL